MSVLPWGAKPGTSGGGSGTVTSVSVATANGFSGTVANATTTPAITIIAGAIVPTSVNSVVLSGSSTPTLAVTGTSTISGSNTGDQTITLTGDVTGSGSGSFATTIKTNVSLPGSPTTTTQSAGDNSTKIATDAFVTTAINNAIAGVNPAVAVQAATTAAGDTSGLTYNNGVSGVGATFTGSNNTAFTIDGFTFTALGQRALIKNDTQSPSGAFNGIYYVTQIQTAILPPILTRALDYDQPSDINNTGAIPVVNGTTQALTSWLLTSAVTTVGTDPLTYTQFSRSPTSVLPPTLGGTGIANNSASTLTISGNFATTLTVSNTTSVTLPTSGTLYGTATGSITSSQLATSLTDETGSGAAVFASSPTLVTPALGTPASGVMTNVTGTASGLTAGNVTTNANLTGPITSSGNATSIASQTGTGTKFVVDTSPTLVTPTLGVASATTINKLTITAPATGSTLTIVDGKTLKVDNTLELAGTDSTVMTFPSTTATIARTDAAQTFTGAQTFASTIYTNNTVTVTSNAGTVPITSRLNTFTNSSAAAMTITLATASATDGQLTVVRIYDFSAVAKGITWVNTENSTVTAPATSNGSTTLPLTVGFMYNNATSQWRCVAVA